MQIQDVPEQARGMHLVGPSRRPEQLILVEHAASYDSGNRLVVLPVVEPRVRGILGKRSCWLGRDCLDLAGRLDSGDSHFAV